MVTAIVNAGDVTSATNTIRTLSLTGILKNSPMAIKSSIIAINANYKDGVNGYEVEMREFSNCFQTKDFIEGTSAFLEKRKPNFN